MRAVRKSATTLWALQSSMYLLVQGPNWNCSLHLESAVFRAEGRTTIPLSTIPYTVANSMTVHIPLVKACPKAKAKVTEVGKCICLLDSWSNKMMIDDSLIQRRENSQEQ